MNTVRNSETKHRTDTVDVAANKKEKVRTAIDPNEERVLVLSAGKGDRLAFRLLVERYQSRAFAIAYEILRRREDAEDVVQESFVKAFLALREFRGQSTFYTWLYRIVYNMAIDFKRKVARRGGDVQMFDERNDLASQNSGFPAVGANDAPDDLLHRKEQARLITAVLQSLSEDHRMVVILREIDGLNYEQIAEVLGISKGTVMSRLHYARKKLQEQLKDLAPSASNGGRRSDRQATEQVVLGARNGLVGR